MAFIRVKRIKGNEYAYLVESRWDPEAKTARQTVLKYLGPPGQVRLEDVPAEHRDEKVEAFVLRHAAEEEERRARLAEELRATLLEALLEGDGETARDVAERGRKALGLDRLYVDVVTSTMHEVGELWAQGEIYVSHEHLASNTLAQVLAGINDAIRWTGPRRGTAAICVPAGERHQLVARVLQGLLANRGYRALDLTASAPSSSVALFLELRKPEVLLVSLTMREHLPALRRLVTLVQEKSPDTRILVGGQGLVGVDDDLPAGVTRTTGDVVADLDRLARG